MAAASSGNVRVKLNFANLPQFAGSKPEKCWFLVNTRYLDTVGDLVDELRQRFHLDAELGLRLTLDGCVLPNWERVQILRDDDLIRYIAV